MWIPFDLLLPLLGTYPMELLAKVQDCSAAFFKEQRVKGNLNIHALGTCGINHGLAM
jgi:hypothetical protein